MDNTEQKFVVCGYAASVSQYIVKAEKAYDLILDVENGEQILTHPMSLEEAQDYIHGL